MKDLRKYVWATTSMVFGSSAVLLSIIGMNELRKAPEPQTVVHQTSFEVQKRIAPPKKKVVEKTPRKKMNNHWTPPAALQGLNSALAGVDVGLPSLQLADMINPNKTLLQTSDDLVMTDDAVDVPPHATRRASIEYPTDAKVDGIEGYVSLNLLIGPSGRVEKAQILGSAPPDVFEQVALDSVMQWQFEPAVYKGQRVKVWAKQTIRFNLG